MVKGNTRGDDVDPPVPDRRDSENQGLAKRSAGRRDAPNTNVSRN